MRFKISEKGRQIIIGKKEKISCFSCGKVEPENKYFFCEVTKKLFCNYCMKRPHYNACGVSRDHTDHIIDEVIRE